MDVSAKRTGERPKGGTDMRILRLELKRMLKSKSTWILLALALVCSALLAWLPASYCYSSYVDETGNVVTVTGPASIAYEKERQADASGVVTPQRVRAAVERYQACLDQYGVTESYDLPEGVYEREILPIAPLLHGLKKRLPTRTPAWLRHFAQLIRRSLTTIMQSVRSGLLR